MNKPKNLHLKPIITILVVAMVGVASLAYSSAGAEQPQSALTEQIATEAQKPTIPEIQAQEDNTLDEDATNLEANTETEPAEEVVADPEPAPVQQATPAATPTPATPAPQPVTPTPEPAPVISGSSTLETASSLSFINSLRSDEGKASLNSDSVANSWALAHARQLAAECDLYHQNIGGFLGSSFSGGSVSSIAENVGYASNTPQVLASLRDSSGHYANMIGDYSHVGIGVVKVTSGSCEGYVYTTQIFVK